MKPKKSSKNVQ